MVKSMFELMWSNLFGVLSSILTPQDVCLVPICLNGFKYALSLTVLFDMHIPRNALAKTLAEFSYTHSFEGSTEECLEAIARNDHLEQEWYQSLTASLENNPFECVKLVRKAVETIKSQFVQEANMKKLRELQNLLVSDVNIVHTSRSYLGQGDIYKVASKISRRLYRLFLFNDSLMYCSGSAKTGFKVHRVIQLAYCRVVPFDKRTAHSLGVSNGFQISNPQKTINLVASSLDDMNEWIKEINDAIDCCLEQRQILLKSADRLSEIGLLDEKISKRLHETCAFIGKSNEMLFSTTEYYRYDDRCKLCFKKFSSFCRPKVCNFCEDPVCSSCFTKKAFISKMDNRVPVCDICFMILEKSTQASDSKV